MITRRIQGKRINNEKERIRIINIFTTPATVVNINFDKADITIVVNALPLIKSSKHG